MKQSAWLLSAALCAIASPGFAQDTQSATSVTESASAPGEEATNAGDIIVTATRRAESLSDVPIAVSAVSAESLQNSGANDIRQLNQLAPSLLVSSTGSEANGSARIRGIGTVGDNPGLESSVAVFVDGVYRSRSGIGLTELGEIDRIEVLRGPQGTLFGRNASAGLIHIISKKPSFDFGGFGELTYGNYDFIRAQGAVTGPITEQLAARLDGVYVKRDGFYRDPANNRRINDRDRYFVRGQLLFEPNEDLSFRLIGDYTKREEECCAAVYLDRATNPLIGNLNEPANPILQPGAVPPRVNDAGNNIVNVLRDLGQPLSRLSDPYSRIVSVTPGRDYRGTTEDYGVSLEANWDFGGATLTSITGYRKYRNDQGSDTDYSTVDILYRASDGGAAREFKTFTQELRLQGSLFNDRVDWLVGGFFSDEDLTVTDNLRFGNQYGRFATCRIVSGGGLGALYSPTSPGCLAARPAAFGAASPIVFGAFDRLDSLNNMGTTQDRYFQNSRNYAIFTHNIVHITDQLDLTLGLRYTNERKKFNATFGNNNTVCTQNQTALTPFLANAALAPIATALIGLSCQGNSTAELNGVTIRDQRKEDEFTGTAVLSYKPTDDLLLYGSYSRGYKAGGFNLDRSALKAPIEFGTTPATTSFAAVGGAQARTSFLQFDPEINDAFEIGAKYSVGSFSLNVAAFRQQFSNFQLNTFNGTVFLVQTVNGCSNNLNGADRDQSILPGAPNYVAPTGISGPGANPAQVTGACAAGDTTYGVRSQGVEIEASLRPARDLNIGLGFTYSDTKFRNNLVGNQQGAPLDPALRVLPGNNLSNAPKYVVTSSLAWTPDIGSSGLRGLIYVDSRTTSDYNTGSDLFPQKLEDSFTVVNARIGLRGPREIWAVELWAQNLTNTNYAQVAFNSPFQAGGTGTQPVAPGFTAQPFADPQFPGGRQLFSAFLAEPRTYGITVRTRF